MATTVIVMMNGFPEGPGLSRIHALVMIICGSTLSSLPEQVPRQGQEQAPHPQGLLMSIAMDRNNVVKWRDTVLKQVQTHAQATGADSSCPVEMLLGGLG